MSDTKITGLPANTTPVSSDVTVIIDDPGGTPASQKITLANLMALFANPVSNDGDGLGTSGLRWSDLFLAAGGIIDWAGGQAVFDDGADGLNISTTTGQILISTDGSDPVEINAPLQGLSGGPLLLGDGLRLAPGQTTEPPMTLDPSGSLMTTPSDGAVEADATNFYGTTDAGNRGYIPIRHFIRNPANRTLTSTTNEQAIWDNPANGRITLEAGVYKFEAILRVSSMSGTSGNARIDWSGAGTATIDTWLWAYNAVDSSGPSPGPVTIQGGWPVTEESAASIATAGTGTAMAVWATGTFDVTVAGTFIPTIDLVTAAAAVVSAGSYFMCERIGASNVVSVGQWD